MHLLPVREIPFYCTFARSLCIGSSFRWKGWPTFSGLVLSKGYIFKHLDSSPEQLDALAVRATWALRRAVGWALFLSLSLVHFRLSSPGREVGVGGCSLTPAHPPPPRWPFPPPTCVQRWKDRMASQCIQEEAGEVRKQWDYYWCSLAQFICKEFAFNFSLQL